MAPTPRSARRLQHSQSEAGLHSGETTVLFGEIPPGDRGTRGRRYFSVADSIKGHHRQGIHDMDDHVPNPFCLDTTQRTLNDYCGLSSVEMASCRDPHHRRGRRHICHGMSKCLAAKTPSTPSLASEAISEESACDHLGHRDKVKDERWKEMLEQEAILEDDVSEAAGGATSHHLARRKGRLGYGKKHYGPEVKWVGYHKAIAINDPGGDDVYMTDKGSFLGPMKKKVGENKFQADCLFSNEVDLAAWKHKKLYADHLGADEVVHASEDVPIGVSQQIDLHSKGFLGKSKRTFGSEDPAHTSSDPISDLSHTPRDLNDISCYGLNHRGKRKFLVQNNLDASCRHNMSRPQTRSTPTLRSVSVPVSERETPPNQTPYWQDDISETQRAVKNTLPAQCRGPRECERNLNNRSGRPHDDSTWSTMTWTPRMVDQLTASAFIEGQDPLFSAPDEEHREAEFRNTMGKTKRSFGNAHNKSNFRFEYNDSPSWKTEHITLVEDKKSDVKHEATAEKLEKCLRWGNGHGRRKFPIPDHLDKAEDGVEVYMSANGSVLGRVKHKNVEDHLAAGADVSEAPVFFSTDGAIQRPRHHKVIKDNVDDLMDNDLRSEDSNTLAVPGMRRSTEMIRPVSARRFPQKDFERSTPRSVTPRAQSEARIPLAQRPGWKK